MYTLIIENRHGKAEAEISFDQGSYTIGRVDGNDVVLASNSVSRTHARIFVSNNKCYIADLGSANGVYVDGTPIHERAEIKNGSKIRIGEYTLYLEYKDQNDINGAGQDVLKTQIVSGGQSGYKIVRVGDKFAGEEFMLTEACNTIGRTEENYILLSDPSISRNHAKIVNQNLNYILCDLNSSNGTYVNRKRIKTETRLSSGDLIRFGNVSFVFAPASQHVDIHAYANVGQKSNDPRTIAIILAAMLVAALLIAFAVFLVIKKDSDQTSVQEQSVTEEQARANLQTRINEAKTQFNFGHFQTAQELVSTLLKEYPSDQTVIALKRQIDLELDYDQTIQEAKAKIDNRDYSDAISLLDSIPESSANFEKAQKNIKETRSRMRLNKYNEARANCDEAVSVDCIQDLCGAVQELDSTFSSEKERIDDTLLFMERMAQKKGKYASSAKKCVKILKNM